MGCSPSNTASTTEQNRGAPLVVSVTAVNNNESNFTSNKVSEEQLHSASQECEKAVVDKRIASAQKDSSGNETEIKTETKSRQLTILHFNDVYNIEPREKEPVGGAARFATKVASLRYLNPLIVFSGDCLNPSTMSSVTSGKQMIPILNALNVDIAVFGNHDFDFGVDELMEFSNATKCPWLLSNVTDNMTGKQLANGEVKRIIKWGGRKIGFIGLVEEEWLVTLATVDREEVTYLDFVKEGTKLAKELRDEGAEFVVALTHMRGPNDHRLAEQATGIDLILGGHDHDYFSQKINGVQVVKSGTDFRELSCITVSFDDDNTFGLHVQRIEITSDIKEDPDVKMTVDKFVGVMYEMMEEVIGEVEVELDGRFSSIRNKETNLGNFVTDIIQNVTEVDCVILNSGTLRSDTLHPPGKFKMKDLSSILPMPDVLVVLELTGDQILEALENGVSQWPKLEGRFPQVAGIRFSFNPKQDPGTRIAKNSVTIDNKPLDKSKKYKVCTKSYLSKGKDGYHVFTKAKVLVDDEDGPILGTIVRNHFRSINIVRGVTRSKSSHRQSLIMRHKGDLVNAQDVVENGWDTTQHVSWRHKPSDVIDVGSRRSSQEFFLSLEKEHTCIAPKVEGRITIITDADEDEDTDSVNLKPVEETKIGDDSKVTNVTGNKDENLPDTTENVRGCLNDGDVKGITTLSDQPVVKDMKQNSEKRVDKQMTEQVNQGAFEQDHTETSYQEVKNDGEQIEVEKCIEQVKSNDDQDSRACHKVNSNELPSKVEDKSAGSPREHDMDNSLQLGADLATEDEYWDLWEAVKVDDIELIKRLRQQKNIRFTRFQDNKTILHLGAERNATKVVKYLVAEGKLNPNITDEILQGVPLHGAAECGSVNAARILLEHGAEINRQDLIGNTALHIACEHEQGEMKRFLVDQGADATILNSDGEVPVL